MPEAYVVREMQQQDLVDRLFHRLRNAIEEFEYPESQRFLFEFGIAILGALRHPDGWKPANGADMLLWNFRRDISTFARVDSETGYVLFLLFQKLMTTMFSDVTFKYQGDSIHRERQLFGARRMEEIPSPGSEEEYEG